jgi:hypothetical protein
MELWRCTDGEMECGNGMWKWNVEMECDNKTALSVTL